MSRYLLTTIKILLFATAITPLIVGNGIFPHTFDKLIFFRAITELVLVLFLILILFELNKQSEEKSFMSHIAYRISRLFKNSIFLSLTAFYISLVVSTIFAVNSYRAFWGDLERGEGFFGLIHYFIFFVLITVIFTKKNWLSFFKLFCFVGIIIGIIAIFQLPFFNFQQLPNTISTTTRPGSSLGNATYLASYLIFVIISSFIVFLNQNSASRFNFWKYFGLFNVFIALVVIFLTRTRGILLGLIVATIIFFLYFIFYENKKSFFLFNRKFSIKKISIFAIAVIFSFFVVFFFTRDNNLWQTIPGLDRLAKTDVFNNKDASTVVRLGGWKIAWESFLEKPIFGWGPESYLYLFNKKYNPDLSLYGDGLWLDRSHSKILDILSAQGIVGFLSYFNIFVVLLFSIIKNQNIRFALKLILVGGIFAYFTQNIFVFDNISSYLGFFALLGFVVSHSIVNKQLPITNHSLQTTYYSLVPKAIIAIIIIIVGYSIYAYNYTPYRQAYGFWRAPKNTNDVNLLVERLKKAMYPYNFAQYNIRGKGIDLIYLDQYFKNENYITNPKFDILGDALVKGMDEFISKEPYDIRILIKKVEMLNAVARARSEKSETLYKESETVLKQVILISPNRQEVYYYLAFNLANQKHFDESIKTAKYAVDLSPTVSRAHYHLGFMYYLAGKDNEAIEELELIENLNPNFENLLMEDINNIIFIYNKYNQKNKVAEIVKKSIKNNNAIKAPFVLMALKYYANIQDKDNFISIASYLENRSGEFKEVMSVFIELAEKDLWSAINEQLLK